MRKTPPTTRTFGVCSARMKEYSTFIFDSYDWDPGEGVIRLRYSLDDEVRFTETLTLPSSDAWPRPVSYRPEEMARALFALHLIGGISYFKTCLPKTIEIRSGGLTPDEAAFWTQVYEHGLGEFFFQNDIDFRGLIQFPSIAKKVVAAVSDEARDSWKGMRVLIPIGGGKDSLVTTELLRAQRQSCTLFRMGQHPLIDVTAETAHLPLLSIKRALSPELFALNADGALNGHVPITAYLSCVTVVMALVYGFDAVAMSNERSADEGNVAFKGMEINHQWSKSLAFERAFQEYLEKSVTRKVSYFSLLRPLSELTIAKLFVQHRQYLRLFTSCNKNWKLVGEKPDKRWCGTCPKCAFSYALLAAFLPRKDLAAVFGGDFFNAPELQTLYAELLGLEGHKPFECVGTPEETAAAFLLAHRQGDYEDTAAMKLFVEKILPGIADGDALIAKVLAPSADHAIPKAFLPALPA